MASGHNAARIGLIVVMCLFFIVMIVFNALAGGEGQKLGIFKNSTGDISDVFQLEITPAGWTFSIWGFIYTWQVLFLIYIISTIFRKVKNGSYIYTLPVMSPWIYVLYILNNSGNTAWLFVWDRQLIIWSMVVIATTPITLYACLAISFRTLYHNLGFLRNEGAGKEVWLIRFLVQNAFAFYAAWVTVASLLNVGMLLVYKGGMANDVACTIVLGILSAVILTWFTLDNTLLDKYVRYTFSPYITFTVAVSGALAKNYDYENKYRNTVFMIALLSTCAIILLFKIVLIIVRHFKNPIDARVEYKATI